MPETYVRRGLYLPSISIKLSTSSGLNSQKVNINSPSLQYIWKPFNPYHPDKHHQPYSLAKQTTPSPCQCNCDISDLILDLTCVTECSSISPGRHGCGHTMFKDYHHCVTNLSNALVRLFACPWAASWRILSLLFMAKTRIWTRCVASVEARLLLAGLMSLSFNLNTLYGWVCIGLCLFLVELGLSWGCFLREQGRRPIRMMNWSRKKRLLFYVTMHFCPIIFLDTTLFVHLHILVNRP